MTGQTAVRISMKHIVPLAFTGSTTTRGRQTPCSGAGMRTATPPGTVPALLPTRTSTVGIDTPPSSLPRRADLIRERMRPVFILPTLLLAAACGQAADEGAL